MLSEIFKCYIARPLIAVSCLLIVAACTTTSQVSKDGDITIERINSSIANISHAYVQYSDGVTTLRGEVKRRFPGRGPIPGHLHVTLYGANGEVISEANIGYMRRSSRSSISTFNTVLPVSLAPGSTVRITHFDTETHEILHEEQEWNSMQQ